MEFARPGTREVRVRITLELDEKWARNFTHEELVDYIATRMNSSLGFRGRIRKLKVLGSGTKRS